MSEIEDSSPRVDRTLAATALSIAPISIGCAIGVLIGGRIGRKHRESLATTLLIAGAAAALPVAVDTVARLINGPESKLGARRTQRGIRHLDGIPYDELTPEEARGEELDKTVDFQSASS